MNEQQKMVAGAVLGIVLIAALLYYFFYKGKGTTNLKLGSGQKKPTGSTQVGGGASSAPNVVYVPAQAGTVDANIVARWFQYSDTMKRIQQNLKDTCSVGAGITVDGVLGTQTLNAIKGFQSAYGKQIAAEIESTKYVTKAQADWLLKPCGTGAGTVGAPMTSDSGAVGGIYPDVTLSNIASAPAQHLAYYLTRRGMTITGWDTEQMREWVYGHLKGATYFLCNRCWNKGYYTTSGAAWVGKWEALPKGAEYTKELNGQVFVKSI